MKTLFAAVWSSVLVVLLVACSATLPETEELEPQAINSVQTIINDMTLHHDAKMHGVPDNYNWSWWPNVGNPLPTRDFRAITAWGQVYEAASGNPAKNTRVYLRNMETYLLKKSTGKWERVQFSVSVQGAAYTEDFAGDVNKPADIRQEPKGGISVTAGGGYNFHFWPAVPRATFDKNDIAGVFTTVQARLVLNNWSGPDDRSKARYLLGVGGDWWLDETAQWDNFKTNEGIGSSRMKFVKWQWQSFNFTTLTPDQLRKNPPPLR